MLSKPALLVADNRSGKLYFTVALSNHPDIHCVRADPLDHCWKLLSSCIGSVFQILWNQPFYKISMFGLYWKRALRYWDVIEAHKPQVKLLALSRDALAQAVSREVLKLQIPGRPRHSWKTFDTGTVTLDPARVKRFTKNFQQRAARRKKFAEECGLPVLFLTYREITGDIDATCVPADATKRICGFLEIPVHPMNQKMHWLDPLPFSDWILNWDEILRAVGRSK